MMDSYILFLELFIPTILGTTAFMAIVATLTHASGEELTDLQYMLVRFFVETGLVQMLLAILAYFLVLNIKDVTEAVHMSAIVLCIGVSIYLPTYIWRRRKVNARTPISSVFVMFGFALDIIALLAIALGFFGTISHLIIQLHFIWVELSMIIVFLQFMEVLLSARRQKHVLSEERS